MPLSTSFTATGEPVSQVQPGPVWNFSAWALSCAGVSRTGSTVMVISATSRPTRSPSRVCRSANIAEAIGHTVVQLV